MNCAPTGSIFVGARFIGRLSTVIAQQVALLQGHFSLGTIWVKRSLTCVSWIILDGEA